MHARSIQALALAALAFSCASATGYVAHAKEPAAKAAPVDLAEIKSKLASGEAAKMKSGLAAARLGGKDARGAAPAIEALLASGVGNDLAIAAIQTLADLGVPSSSAALRPWTRHRNADVRRAAVKAAIKTGGPEAIAALTAALGDADAGVRGFAATGLGELRAKGATPELLGALDRRVNEAAASIGMLCAGADCEKLVAKLGVLAFDVVTSGLEPLLFRPASEVGDEDKVKIIVKVRDLATPDAGRWLREVQKRWPASGSARVKIELDRAVAATASAAAPSGGEK